MKKILTVAAALGNAAGRSLNVRGAEYPGWAYYPNSMWASLLWQGGFDFETPPPMITKEGLFKPLPPTGARTLDSRTAFCYGYTMDSPGMIMGQPNVGSQYLMGFSDAQKNPFDGSKTYPSPAPVENTDGSTTIYFGPTKPAEAKAGNWIQTTPNKGWFTILRLYSPLESLFTKAW